MKKIHILTVAIAFASAAFTFNQSTSWKSSENDYTVSFKGDKVDGAFKGLKSSVVLDDAHPEKSKISASIDATTVSTGNGMMNKHAQSSDALDTKKHGSITFESTEVVKKGSSYTATGKLTMKGVSKTITIPFTFSEKGQEAQLSGSFSVAPKDYGITRKGTPKQIEISLAIKFNN